MQDIIMDANSLEEIISGAVADQLAIQATTTGGDILSWAFVTLAGLLLTGTVTAAIRIMSSLRAELVSIRILCDWLKVAHQDPDSPFATEKMLPIMDRIISLLEDRIEYDRWAGKMMRSIFSRVGGTGGDQLLVDDPSDKNGGAI